MKNIDRVTLWTTLVAGTAWACLLFVDKHHNPLPVSLPSGHASLFGAGLSGRVSPGLLYDEAAHWLLMVTAMMLPLLVVPIRQVAFRSYRWRRGKAITGFLAGYVVIWMFAGMLCGWVFFILGAAELVPASIAAPVTLLVAAIWQLSTFRAAAMRKCHRTVALAPRGLAADLDCIRFGLSHGFACLGVCLPLMLATMISIHSIAATVVLALLLYFERGYQPLNRAIPGIMLTYCSGAMAYSLLS